MSDNNPPADHVFADSNGNGKAIEDNLKSKATWTRFLFMVVCSILVWLASIVGSVVVVLGFLMVLFTGEVNRELRGIGQSLATYIYENIRYLTFNTEERPFPFGGEWPSASDEGPSD
jgi:hypothetical protein